MKMEKMQSNKPKNQIDCGCWLKLAVELGTLRETGNKFFETAQQLGTPDIDNKRLSDMIQNISQLTTRFEDMTISLIDKHSKVSKRSTSPDEGCVLESNDMDCIDPFHPSTPVFKMSKNQIASPAKYQASESINTEIESYVETSNPYIMEPIKIGERFEAKITCVDSPTNFFVSRCGGPYKFSDMVHETGLKLKRKRVQTRTGMVHSDVGVLALFDKKWYRAIITSTSFPKVEVYFVDFGNSDHLNHTDLLPLPKSLAKYPVRCYNFSLADLSVSPSQEQRKKFNDRFQESTRLFVKPISVLIQSQTWTDLKWKVEIFDREKLRPVTDLYVSQITSFDIYTSIYSGFIKNTGIHTKDFCREPGAYFQEPLIEGQRFPAQICHIENPGCFYVVKCSPHMDLEKYVVTVNSIGEDVKWSGEKIPKDWFDIMNLPLLALYENDKQWYRAKFLGEQSDKVLVQFVDRGNIETVSVNDLLPIPDWLAELPVTCYQCSLTENFSPASYTKQELNEFISKLTVNSNVVLRTEKLLGGVEGSYQFWKVSLYDPLTLNRLYYGASREYEQSSVSLVNED